MSRIEARFDVRYPGFALDVTLDHHWFSEIHPATGSAFSLKLQGKLHEARSPYQRVAV